jgi:hypothetical protein
VGLLDTIKEQDERQQSSEMLERLTSTLPAVEQQLTKLTQSVADLTTFVRIMDEQQDTRLNSLSTSLPPEPPSGLPLDDATKSRLIEIENTLAAIAKQLSASEAVKLPDGHFVRRSDLDAHTMMLRLEEQVEATTSASNELADSVRKRGVIRVDAARLSQQAIDVLDARLAVAVEPSVSRLEARLAEWESRTALTITERMADTSSEVERIVARVEDAVHAAGKAERRVNAMTTRMTWNTAGRLCLALVPSAAVLLVLGGLTVGAVQALGVGPLLGWAWSAFEVADAWWAKALIAGGTIGGIVLSSAVIWKLGLKLADQYRRW